MQNDFDLIVVGGGYVGSAFVAGLQSLPLKIAIIEKSETDHHLLQDKRSIVLSHRSKVIFEHLGCWSLFSDHVTRIQQIQTSERGRFGTITLSAKQMDVDALGYVIEGGFLLRQLMDLAFSQANVTVFRGAKLVAVHRESEKFRVEFEQEGRAVACYAPSLIAADGTHSAVREAFGISCRVHDYQQRALVANVTVVREQDGCAYERFTSEGAIAFLPRSGRQYGLVWSAPNELANSLDALSDEAFLLRLSEVFGGRLGRFESISKRFSYPLQYRIAEKIALNEGVVFLGNAAHTLHPIAAQGFNLGLRDAYDLASIIRSGLSGSMLIEAYQQQRKADQKRTIDFTHRLVKTFDVQNEFLGPIRSVGMALIEYLPFVKRALFSNLSR